MKCTKNFGVAAFTLSLSLISVAGPWASADDHSPASASELKISLDYLKLTPDEIKDRDEKLGPIYDFYRNATAEKLASSIEETFGSQVFRLMAVGDDHNGTSLDDKRGVMDAAVFYYLGYSDQNLGFSNVDSRVLPRSPLVYARNSDKEYTARKVSGNDDFPDLKSEKCTFLLGSWDEKDSQSHEFMWWDWSSEVSAAYSTLSDKAFEMPVIQSYFDAMIGMNLRALDAMVVFVGSLNEASAYVPSGNGGYYTDPKSKAWSVVYPRFNKLAPIPQPIVFIDSNATQADIEDLLVSQAPQIYAYNKLFNEQLLPTAADMAKLFKSVPALADLARAAAAENKQMKLEEAVNDAYLKVSYAILTGIFTGNVIPLMSIANDPKLGPILVELVGQM